MMYDLPLYDKNVTNATKHKRASVIPEVINNYFEHLEHDLTDIPPDNIWNDELRRNRSRRRSEFEEVLIETKIQVSETGSQRKEGVLQRDVCSNLNSVAPRWTQSANR